jgi:UDP-N-acetylglucosamine--N-acetylmuramyl-(pentapeptide) pyrophosphoryl-undecaprenol N-acetylglucosamine transferase
MMVAGRGTILLAGGGTGGHVFPMVAVADALRELAPDLRLVFVGTEKGIETRVVPERGYELELMEVIPIRGGGFAGALRGVVRAAASLPEAWQLLARLNPRAVFSLGGYAAGPVSLAARLRGVPLTLNEPNAVIGLANRLTAPMVTRAYTAFPEPERHFYPSAVLRSGVPIRSGFEPRPYRRQSKLLKVLVLGGSQGAKALNEAVPAALGLTKTPVRVVHQCGRAHAEDVAARYRALGAGKRAEVVPFIDDMPAALTAAELVISRAGASAVSEICAVGRPSILVPYPYAAADHQRYNALSIEQAGAGLCVSSDAATPSHLAAEIDRIAAAGDLLDRMAAHARQLGRPHAAYTIARDLLGLAHLAETLADESSDRGAQRSLVDSARFAAAEV